MYLGSLFALMSRCFCGFLTYLRLGVAMRYDRAERPGLLCRPLVVADSCSEPFVSSNCSTPTSDMWTGVLGVDRGVPQLVPIWTSVHESRGCGIGVGWRASSGPVKKNQSPRGSLKVPGERAEDQRVTVTGLSPKRGGEAWDGRRRAPRNDVQFCF